MKKKLFVLLTVVMALVCMCSVAFAENEIVSNTIRLTLVQEEVTPVSEEVTPVPEEAADTLAAKDESPEKVPAETEMEKLLLSEATDVRLAGDGMSEIVLTIDAQTEVTILSQEGNWALVEIDGAQGYIYIEPQEEEPAAEEEAEAAAPSATPSVEIFTSRRVEVQQGDPITLSSKAYDTEGYELRYQWQINMGDGWCDISGANEETFTFEATEDTLNYSYRLNLMYRPLA